MGKTTLFNYIRKKLRDQTYSRILPVYTNNIHVQEPGENIDPSQDPQKLRFNFCLRTVENIYDAVENSHERGMLDDNLYNYFKSKKQKYYTLKGATKIDQSTAERLLKDVLNELKASYDIFVLLYDEIDKVTDYKVVASFLRSSQGLFEDLSQLGCVMFFSAIMDFKTILHSFEYSGVGGYEIEIQPWNAKEAKTLIQTRLNYSMYAGGFPIEDDVLEKICQSQEGRPRLIQRRVRDALVWAAHLEKRKIDGLFLDNLVWKMESVKQFDEMIRNSKELKNAADALQRLYNPDADDPNIYFILMATFKTKRLFKLPAPQMRERYGIDIDIDNFDRLIHLLKDRGVLHEKVSGQDIYYVLEPGLDHLFEFVKTTLMASLEYLPNAIRTSTKEVEAIPQEFDLHGETLKLFIASPQTLFTRQEIVGKIFQNYDAKNRALRYYRVITDSQLQSKLDYGLPPVLNKLFDDGAIIKIWAEAKGGLNKYKYSEKSDWSQFKGLQLDEDVFQNLQSSDFSFDREDYGGTISLMRTAVETSLRHLCEVANVEIPAKQSEDTLSPINVLLLQQKVYDRGTDTRIAAFAIQANPIAHGRVKVNHEQAKNLRESGNLIIKEIYQIMKSRR